MQCSVYPNPSPGFFILDLPVDADVKVINALGQVILTGRLAAGKTPVNLNGEPGGIYFMVVKCEPLVDRIKVIKIIKTVSCLH